MRTDRITRDPIAAVALLDEPTRGRIYELAIASREPVGRDDVAAALGISRELAAFHLDRLVTGGLLDTEFRRRNGRRGPGAGRPAKFYRRTEHELVVSLPARHYATAADVLAEGLTRLGDPAAIAAVVDVARERGAALGAEARRQAGPRPSRRRLLASLLELLGGAGFEPEVDEVSGSVCLRNCPYHALIADHRDLTCGMNLAWADGVAAGIDGRLRPELTANDGYCCVEFKRRP